MFISYVLISLTLVPKSILNQDPGSVSRLPLREDFGHYAGFGHPYSAKVTVHYNLTHSILLDMI